MRNLPMPEINTEMKYFENHDAAIMIVFMLEFGVGDWNATVSDQQLNFVWYPSE